MDLALELNLVGGIISAKSFFSDSASYVRAIIVYVKALKQV